MFAIETIWAVLLFGVIVFGSGAALGPRGVADPLLRVSAGVAIAFGLAFVVGFGAFAAGLSNSVAARLVAAGAAGVMLVRIRPLREALNAPPVREFLLTWLVFAGWALGLLALVVTYSGGAWAVDWVEHWQRTVFFLNRQPLSTAFAVMYPLTARPPLANALTALWLEATSRSFAEYQVFTTLFGTLVLLPLWILVLRWSHAKAARVWLLLALFVTPMVAQNLTFAWTKMPTACFVLLGLCFVLPANREARPPLNAVAGLCFGLAILTHYSAVPWFLCCVLAAVVAARSRWREPNGRRNAAIFGAIAAAVVLMWVGWAWVHYGWKSTVAANSTAASWASESGFERLAVPAENLFDTLVPFPVRGEPDDGTLAQTSRLGRLRDIAFDIYQVNLPLGVGLGGLWVLLRLLAHRDRKRGSESRAGGERTFFQWLVPAIVVLGVVVHTPRDEWGLAHICLQPLVLLGIAKIAATLPTLSRSALGIWIGLAGVDFVLGIALQFGIESWALAPVIAPHASRLSYVHALSQATVANANDKWAFGFDFFSDRLGAPPLLIGLWLALLATFVIVRLRSTSIRPAV